MATKRKKKNYVTIKIGEYEVTTKAAGKHMRKVYSRVDETVAAKLGVKGKPEGERIIRKIRKGRAAGAQYAAYALGVRGKGYGLGFLALGNSSDVASKSTNLKYKPINIPVPSGTPLAVVAKFAAKLKSKPQKIVTPKGRTFYLNNSKNSQG
jgi:hypothetical protein